MFKARDPVCKVRVSKKTPYRLSHRGKTYYFDCQACKETFEDEPQQFIKRKCGRDFLSWIAKGSKDIPKSCHEGKKLKETE